MLRGTQVRIWQPLEIGENQESPQDFRGTVLQTHSSQVVSVLFFPKLRDVASLVSR